MSELVEVRPATLAVLRLAQSYEEHAAAMWRHDSDLFGLAIIGFLVFSPQLHDSRRLGVLTTAPNQLRLFDRVESELLNL